MRARAGNARGAPARLGIVAPFLVLLMGPGIDSRQHITVKRFTQNPLITTASSATLGDNIDGPTVIRVPDWVERPLGRYYMYFAHHMGSYIRLAYADALTGPWRIHEPGVLHARETAFSRPAPERIGTFYTHVASPEIFIDAKRKRMLMWCHGWWTDGQPWPFQPGETDRQGAMAGKGYWQRTQVAESSDGLRFDAKGAVTDSLYLRVFPYRGYFYGLGDVEGPSGPQPARLSRSASPRESFTPGPGPFRDGPYERRVRHVGLVRRDERLYVFFTAVGDTPERVLLSTIDLDQDWTSWRAKAPVEVLAPEAAYECADKPNERSRNGNAPGPVRQIRDPFVFEESGKLFLFYSICGESGIAAAELTIR